MKARFLRKHLYGRHISLAATMTFLVTGIVGAAVIISMVIFNSVYNNSIQNNAVTASEQAVVQTTNAIGSYLTDMNEVMEQIAVCYEFEDEERDAMLNSLMTLRSDVVLVTSYNSEGVMENYWSMNGSLKNPIYENLSYDIGMVYEGEKVYISKPHVESVLVDYYPWVVSISRQMTTDTGETTIVVMDILFSKIASYVDDVGIGAHGYSFIMNADGSIIYHPQQQLIFSGLKIENTKALVGKDGYKIVDNVIYTTQSLDNSNWKVVGVSYVSDMITDKTQKVGMLNIILLIAVVFATFLSSIILSNLISRPIKNLIQAMKDFEKNTELYSYKSVNGTKEIALLSNSYEHMVDRIKILLMKIRQEEITLKKTELKALQAQINPHFLYNTLDAIGWLCEEDRSADAVQMVNSLARLFRISISKGREMITIEKEIEHAKSYLEIEKFRYKNQFTYEFEVDQKCLRYYCNKITLQPIIENAIYHGLNRMVDEGKIIIKVKDIGEDIEFVIMDNGIGMTEEECNSILNKEANDRTGIGIKNVNDRIKIYFGENYGLNITSELDVGTSVFIKMPKVKEEDLHDEK